MVAELDAENLQAARRLAVVCLSTSTVDAIIAALEDRDRLRAWMESDYLLTESFKEWAALEGRDG